MTGVYEHTTVYVSQVGMQVTIVTSDICILYSIFLIILKVFYLFIMDVF